MLGNATGFLHCSGELETLYLALNLLNDNHTIHMV